MRFKKNLLQIFLNRLNITKSNVIEMVGSKEVAEHILAGGLITDRDVASVMVNMLGASLALDAIDWEGIGIEKPRRNRIFNKCSYAY